jgi:hypothetical protein
VGPCSGLEDVIISCASHDHSSHAVASDFIRNFPSWISGIKVSKKLTIAIPYCKLLTLAGNSYLPHIIRDTYVKQNIEIMNSTLGVEGKLVKKERAIWLGGRQRKSCKRNFIEQDVFAWEAEEDGILDCSGQWIP